jgi:hypothetical protein
MTAKQQQKAPVSTKHYDTDNDDEEVNHSSNKSKQDLDFNNILKQWGVTDLNKLIGGTSESETERRTKSKANGPVPDKYEEKKGNATFEEEKKSNHSEAKGVQ